MNSNLMDGIYKVAIVIILFLLSGVALTFLTEALNMASTLFNIGGALGIFVLLTIDALILKRVFTNKTK